SSHIRSVIFGEVAAVQLRIPAFSSLGCLFENELCSSYEICVNDIFHYKTEVIINMLSIVFNENGMFGRCHSVPVRDVYTYDVSPSVVQRFRILLEKLSNRGLTWEDDTTQQVLSSELSRLRRIPYRPQQRGPIYSSSSRPAAEAMDPEDQRVKPVEVELNRNLQTYLQRLGLLPKTSSASSLIKPGKPLQKQKPLSSQLLASQADGDLLLAALRRFLSGRLSLHGARMKQEAASPRLRPFYNSGVENPGFKKETSQSRLVKTGSSPAASAKEPLTSVDERFIEKVVKNVGRQHVDVDSLTPQDLSQLSSLIADALVVVDQDQGPDRPLSRDRGPGLRDLEGERSDSSQEASRAEEDEVLLQNVPTLNPDPQESTPLPLAALQERHTDAVDDLAQSSSLFNKLLAYLDRSSLSDPLSVRSRYDVAAAPRGRQVGLENVQSHTSEAAVAVQKKDTTQSVEEVSEVAGWIKEVVPPPASLVYEEPHKKTMHAPELQLDVKTDRKKPDDDVFGYVITDTDRLQTDEGLHLMEILAHRAKIQMTDFAELLYLQLSFSVPHKQQTRRRYTVAVLQRHSLAWRTYYNDFSDTASCHVDGHFFLNVSNKMFYLKPNKSAFQVCVFRKV
ncbi:hypothetical protein CCH79_00009765, partial [Gambusia affinis]